jgi:hypothetical protein
MAESRTYANTTCPYCTSPLDPLPKAKKRCPACGQSIYVRSGPDGVRYLLQEIDLPVLEEAWAEDHDAIARTEAARMNREAARMTREALRQYREFGVGSVLLYAADDCVICTPLGGKTFLIDDAPPIPMPGCPNVADGDVCPCDYAPVVGR